jgi:hypothetical protein
MIPLVFSLFLLVDSAHDPAWSAVDSNGHASIYHHLPAAQCEKVLEAFPQQLRRCVNEQTGEELSLPGRKRK